jgi:histidinol phosphatase-like PHP family hydrolase
MGVLLELSGRKGHSLTNGHVARMAARVGAKLAVNADAHGPGDFLSAAMARNVALGAGVSPEEYEIIRRNMKELVESK